MDVEGDDIEVEDIPPLGEEEEKQTSSHFQEIPKKLSKKERMKLKRAMKKKTLKRKRMKKKEKRQAEKAKLLGLQAAGEKDPTRSTSIALLSLQYLRLWQKDRPNWKFNKRCQTWLLRSMCNSAMVSKVRRRI